ncbi:Ankyrin repeat domain-containing protein 44, partial [Xylographa trunciseda]|nr:Ankyrin repeat domain-containing protein 44 [Xylographa trunciseda]
HPPLRNNRYILHLDAYGWDYVDVGTITPCLIIEYAQHGNMRQYLETRSNEEPDERYLLWKGIAEGLFALHSCGIVHGDVKLDNILIAVDSGTSEIVPKIADFGSSLFKHPDIKYQRYLGTAIYNAPEIYSQARGVTSNYLPFGSLKACDAYSLGLLVWETFKNGKLYRSPWDADGETHVRVEDLRVLAVQELDQVPGMVVKHQEQIRAVLLATIHENPSDRKTMEEVLIIVGQAIIESSYEPLDVPKPQFLGYMDFTIFEDVIQTIKPSNFEHAGPATIMPWPVHELLSSAFRQSCQSKDNIKAGLAALNLSICYSVGLGVERDTEQLLYWLRESARKGCREARIIARRVYDALGASYDEVCPVEFEGGKMESYLATLEAATRRAPYTTPFHELWQVGVSIFWTLLPSDDEENVLHKYSLLGTPDNVSQLLRAGVEDHQDEHGQTALLLACRRGNMEIVKLLVSAGSDASIADSKGRTPLHMLVMFPANEVAQAAELLLSSPKVNVNATFLHNSERAPDYWAFLRGSPLEWATICGNRAATKVLIDNMADVTNAIFAAVSLHLDDILHMLLEAPQCKVDSKSLGLCFCYMNMSHPFRRMLMHGADSNQAMLRTVDVLRSAWNANLGPAMALPDLSSHGHDSLGTDEIGPMPLTMIATFNLSHQDPDIARALLLLTHVRSGKIADEVIEQALLGSLSPDFESNDQIITILIEAGFPLSVRNEIGWSPVHMAANAGKLVVVKAILRRDPSMVNLRAREGTTPLHVAVNGINPLSTIKVLLSYGADPALTCSGSCETPLGMYIHYGKLYSVQSVLPLLMELGRANGFIAVSSGETWQNALHYAAWFAAAYELRSPRAAGMLSAVLQQSAIRSLINLPAGDGYTALLSVCHNVHLASARMLIDAGADIHARTKRDLNCLELAMFRTRTALSRRLPHNTYAKRLPEAYELCMYLAQVFKRNGRDLQYTPLHIAVFIGYVEEALKILQQDPSQALARDAEGWKARELLIYSILSQHIGEDAYLASCDPAFVTRTAILEQMLLKTEIQASGGLLR